MKRKLGNLALALGSLVLSLVVIELSARWVQSQPLFRFRNFRAETRILYQQGLPVQFDSVLGWIPKVGYSGRANRWHTRVTILDRGIRSNGRATPIPRHPSVLAVGDSFTFGDEVSDHETWPALLERRLQESVVNAGVFAFGTDQSYLRLRQLLPIYTPETIIFGFIGDDLDRCEFSRISGVPKPFFDVADGALELGNSPVPEPTTGAAVSRFSEFIGHSSIVHALMMKWNPNAWLSQRPSGHARTENDGAEITCLIFGQLEALSSQYGVDRVIVLVQDTPHPQTQEMIDETNRALACINRQAIEVVDIRGALHDLRARNPERYRSFFKTHMTPAGNGFVAGILADRLSGAHSRVERQSD